MIHEVIVTTGYENGEVHIAPMGIRRADGLIVIAPFRPSATLENLQRDGVAVVNMTDNVKIFAGCLTGRRDWPLLPATKIHGRRLEDCLSHQEVEVDHSEDDDLRPRFYCRVVHSQIHRAFSGFNRAQAAVLEAAILVSRLDMLPEEKVRTEIDYHRIAIEKTAGADEREAWQWLMQKIAAHSFADAEKTGP